MAKKKAPKIDMAQLQQQLQRQFSNLDTKDPSLWPLLPRVMLLTALVVVLMTWGVAPQLTRLLRPWLYPPPRRPG